MPGFVWRKEKLRSCHEEEVPGVVGSRNAAGVRVGSPDRAGRAIWGSPRRRCASACARSRSIGPAQEVHQRGARGDQEACRERFRAAPGERDPEVRSVFSPRSSTKTERSDRYIDEHRGRFGVEPICKTLGVSASAYYERASGRRSARAVEDERLLEQPRAARGQLLRLRVAADVEGAAARRRAGRPRPVERLMRHTGFRARSGAASRGGRPRRIPGAAPADLVKRDFSAAGPDGCGSRTSPTCAAGRASCSSLRDRRLQPADRGLAVRCHMRTDSRLGRAAQWPEQRSPAPTSS